MLLVIISLILIIIYFSTIKSFENYVSYYKCNKPINKVTYDILKKNKFIKDIKQNSNLYLPCNYTNVEKELNIFNVSKYSNLKFIYAIDGCDKIVSKNNLWKLLVNNNGKKIAKMVMPNTFIISNKNDMAQLKKKCIKKHNKRFILKKNIQRKKGLYLSNNYNDILKTINNDPKYKIIQEFKESYEVKNRKFNLRIYYLVICTNNKKQFFYHSKGKCIYADKDSNNSFSVESNIPNIYNKTPNIYNGRPFYLDELYKYLDSKHFHHNLKHKIETILKILSTTISHSICKMNKLNKYKLFQLFGLDILVDDQLNPFILEINKGPDLNIPEFNYAKDYDMKKTVLEDMLHLNGLIQLGHNHQNKFIEL